MRMKLIQLLILVFACLSGGVPAEETPGSASHALAPDETTASGLPSTDLAPNWILPDLEGKPISLYEEAEAGKTTVMFFWASWCRSCKSLMPVIKALDSAKGERPITFYLMNVWEDNDPVAFLKQHDVNLPMLRQAENVAQRYDIRITPGIVVVDSDRRIRYMRSPHEGVAEVTAELQRVLNIQLPRKP